MITYWCPVCGVLNQSSGPGPIERCNACNMPASPRAVDVPGRTCPPPKERVRGQITVGELITVLQALPQDALVEAEGCDCYGPCSGASVYGNIVSIDRVS